MRRCTGAVVLAMPRWQASGKDRAAQLPSEFAHYEGAVAYSLKLPLLVLAEKGLEDRGIIWTGAGHPIAFMPSDATPGWLGDEAFEHRFGVWRGQLESNEDVFLGYCSRAKIAAQAVHLFLSHTLGLKVRDWAMDFGAGETILTEIQHAAKSCSSGIFLFTRDDDQVEGDEHRAAPRDNVVFEAGFFASARGPNRILIIREAGAKMPADLGGYIYLTLADRTNIGPIEQGIRDFVTKRV